MLKPLNLRAHRASPDQPKEHRAAPIPAASSAAPGAPRTFAPGSRPGSLKAGLQRSQLMAVMLGRHEVVKHTLQHRGG